MAVAVSPAGSVSMTLTVADGGRSADVRDGNRVAVADVALGEVARVAGQIARSAAGATTGETVPWTTKSGAVEFATSKIYQVPRNWCRPS